MLHFAGRRAISIHALREEGDFHEPDELPGGFFISIHALREEGDAISIFGSAMDDIFLSTPSARRATGLCSINDAAPKFLSTPSARRATAPPGAGAGASKISIHALREEGDFSHLRLIRWISCISIHALREEGDPCAVLARVSPTRFLSTPSARRATVHV